jgi:hypothetical protein
MGKMKKNKLEYASKYLLAPKLKASKIYIPEWFKNIRGFSEKNMMFYDSGEPILTAKNCIAYFDAITCGYIIELVTDIVCFKDKDGIININWKYENEIIEGRLTSLNTIPVPTNHYEQHYAFDSIYNFRMPKGYSALFTHPLNRHDLPFTTLSGIIDLDFGMYPGKIPFFLKKDFEGIIPAGTPIAQIIPFKRENWESIENKELLSDVEKIKIQISKKIYSGYKTLFWNKKTYD